MDPFAGDPDNDTLWWGGGTWWVDAGEQTFYGDNTEIFAKSTGDTDGDGIPDIYDPYVNDGGNNTLWWQGGSFWISICP